MEKCQQDVDLSIPFAVKFKKGVKSVTGEHVSMSLRRELIFRGSYA
jgi:hypothetical protein